MRHFYVYSPVWSQEYNSIWTDCGFIPVSDLAMCKEQPPDVIVSYGMPAAPADFWQTAKAARSKIVMVAAASFHCLPEEARDMYEEQRIEGEGLCFMLATRLEGEIPCPVWDMYRVNSQLSEPIQHKVMADTLYRYLLNDVLRETFEWCGHTFSVLGPA